MHIERFGLVAVVVRESFCMPKLFAAISTWFTAKAWRTIVLAATVLIALLAFGIFRESLGLIGAIAVSIVWWIVLVVVWFHPSKWPKTSGVSAWGHALFLDLFLLLIAAIAIRFGIG